MNNRDIISRHKFFVDELFKSGFYERFPQLSPEHKDNTKFAHPSAMMLEYICSLKDKPSTTAMAVCWFISTRMGWHMCCWHALDTIADAVCISRSTAKRALLSLKECGAISIIKCGGLKTKTGKTNLYIIGDRVLNSWMNSTIDAGSRMNHLAPRESTDEPPFCSQMDCHGGSPVTHEYKSVNIKGIIDNTYTSAAPPVAPSEHHHQGEHETEDKNAGTKSEELSLVQNHWNEISNKTGVPSIKFLTNKRKKALRKILKEFGLEALLDAISRIEDPENAFLRGTNSSGWKATFDWIVNPNNLVKVLEDVYKGRIRSMREIAKEAEEQARKEREQREREERDRRARERDREHEELMEKLRKEREAANDDRV